MKLICLFVVLIYLNQKVSSIDVIDGIFKNLATFSKYKKKRYYCFVLYLFHYDYFAVKTGIRNVTNYYLTRSLQAIWMEALLFCQKFNMDMLTLETEEEHNNFQIILKNNIANFDSYTYIGAVELKPFSKGPNAPWMWVNSGQLY